MTLIELLKTKIKRLENVIEFRDTDEKWRETWKPSDTGSSDENQYFWMFTGEREKYQGRLEALKELLEEVK